MTQPASAILPTDADEVPAELLLRAVDTSCFGVTLADARRPDLPLAYTNRAFERMTGYDKAEVIGRNCRFLQGPDTDPNGVARVRATIQTESASTFLLLNYRKDGSRFWNRFQLSPVHDEAGRLTAYLGMQVDITDDIDRIGLESERQKLETLGRLAGGVAHEINNALQPIQLYAEMLSDEALPSRDMRLRCASGILEHARFASEVVGQVLSYARRDSQEPEDHEVLAVLSDAVEFAAEYVPSSMTVARTGFAPHGPLAGLRVSINRTALLQVMANLFKNAADATKDKGTIVVDAALVQDPSASDRLQGPIRKPSPTHLRVSVTDNGCGMDAETRTHIFEPFFTTKAPGLGTGLGLSTIYGIVERWHGRIDVDSEPGRGTSFRLLIPVSSPSHT